MEIKYFTKELLIKANLEAKVKKLKFVPFVALIDSLSEDSKFPVVSFSLSDDTDFVTAELLLNPQTLVELEVTLKTLRSLPYVSVDPSYYDEDPTLH
tara:strand:+ start:1442 stop:1732 length:291 start_codon:yes stop_codon:yes gene_type:complete